jgi:TPP-dependent 2-oxoacid decarboxylase
MNTCIPSQPGSTTVVGYLLTRLAEAGVASVFGVPGDYDLGLLDAITARPQLAWIGMATEQGDELAWALVAANYHAGAGRPVLIEAVLGADDTPPMLRELSRALAHR